MEIVFDIYMRCSRECTKTLSIKWIGWQERNSSAFRDIWQPATKSGESFPEAPVSPNLRLFIIFIWILEQQSINLPVWCSSMSFEKDANYSQSLLFFPGNFEMFCHSVVQTSQFFELWVAKLSYCCQSPSTPTHFFLKGCSRPISQ